MTVKFRPRPARPTATARPDPRVKALMTWFSRHRRPLPWRRHPTPYRIWVAEVLLQQTRVAQAAPYFERFVRRFPNVSALARASEEQVLKAWEGAGYYARARHLHQAARQIQRERAGELPHQSGELRQLPGVGPYIAAAVASLAFHEPIVALDANGFRVLARWTLERRDLHRAAAQNRLRRWAMDRLPARRSAEFNEGLMELGETICLPLRPECTRCPVAGQCRARQELPDPGALPTRRPPRAKPQVVAAVVAVNRGGRWLVLRRPSTGLLGGLWEFPGGKVAPRERPVAAAARELREETGLTTGMLEELGVVRHEYSHFRVALHLFRTRSARGRVRVRGRRHRWVGFAELRRLPLPRATLKMLPPLERAGKRDRASRDSGSRRGRTGA
ncbi:MAG: A/G-specific adenine glycosylase [Thermoplasmata archaeon]|nr:A/G-specific adenine glycosylase [Thermoplasmata archaeon]